MPDKSKAPKELVDIAEEQGVHAAKNLGAAATKAVEDILPRSSGGLFIPNKALFSVVGVTALGLAIAAANRIKKAQEAKKAEAEAKKDGAVVKPTVVDGGAGRAA